MSNILRIMIDLTGDDDDELVATGSKVPAPGWGVKKPRLGQAAEPGTAKQATAGALCSTASSIINVGVEEEDQDENELEQGSGQVRLHLICETRNR
jgi:hypothetical protein